MTPKWLPNWRNPKEYPDPAKTARLDWAWQFLRRNPDYQNLWSQLIAPNYDRKHVVHIIKQQRGSARLYSDRARPRLIETSGDYDLPPFVSQFGITSIPPDPSEKKAELQFAAQFIRYRPGGMRKVSPDLQDHEVLVWFNLQWPIEAQLNSARQVLEQQIKAKNLAGAPFRFRYRPEKYANYLRVLDAKATNMSDEAIASVIYPNLPDSHPEHAGSHRVRDDLAAAKRLRDNPWLIVARGK